MTPLGTIIKDPSAKLRYEIDWTVWLGDDLIRLSTWTITPDDGTLVGYDDAIDEQQKRAFIWVRGGTLGKSYTLTNRIKTIYGETHDETDERSFIMTIQER